ncbi:hypothetical protein CVT25_009877 [Psilocybe cyanescens]|uniref:Casein kinase II subunit beta n=1 Tax=Psilocybe cyanescens TaxID=93625 RepID=A0A409XT73_PSICY|nr:hypothetical protein CVT25_009877 [Psilocybe cyanescens]
MELEKVNVVPLNEQERAAEEREQTHQAERIDVPPDIDQGVRPSKTYHPFSFPVIVLLMPAAVFGVLARLGLIALMSYDGNSVFPLVYVQAMGCLIMGIGLRMKEPMGQFYGPLYTALTTGFCGSLTTFSSWQADIFNTWINARQYRRGGLRDFVDGVGLSVITLSLSLASISFGYNLACVVSPMVSRLGFARPTIRYGLSCLSLLIYGATFFTYFFLPARYRHQATAALLFAFPGALTRYILSISLNRRIKAFPLGTLTANTLGTALFAAFHVLQSTPHPPSPNACSILQGLIDGYCGCLTTMASRQRAPAEDPQQPIADEEPISGTGEGDEIMEEAEDQEDGYTSSTPTSTLTWISWFCSLPGHEYFCEVTEDFIEDDFNLTGLNTMVPFWKEAMEMVLDVEPDEDTSKIPDVSIVESSAEMLYGLVHQRYILTRVGLQAMAEKYESGVFGTCPRVYCVGCNVVPCGRVDIPGNDTVKLFCPNCNDIYVPPSSRFQGVDGAFFGTTFAHLFFQTYRELAPAPFWKAPSVGGSPLSPRSVSGSNGSRTSPFVNPNPHGGQKRAAGYVYVPRIYGFKVSERAKSGPRMQWLRLRPESPEELDSVDWRGRWINEDDEYDDEEEEEEDRRMEDFDPDAADEDDDEEEEEEEEEAGASNVKGSKPGKQVPSSTTPSQSSLPPTVTSSHSARTSPTSSGVPRTPEVRPLIDLSAYGLSSFGRSLREGKVKMVRQSWMPRTDWAGTAQV